MWANKCITYSINWKPSIGFKSVLKIWHWFLKTPLCSLPIKMSATLNVCLACIKMFTYKHLFHAYYVPASYDRGK